MTPHFGRGVGCEGRWRRERLFWATWARGGDTPQHRQTWVSLLLLSLCSSRVAAPAVGSHGGALGRRGFLGGGCLADHLPVLLVVRDLAVHPGSQG